MRYRYPHPGFFFKGNTGYWHAFKKPLNVFFQGLTLANLSVCHMQNVQITCGIKRTQNIYLNFTLAHLIGDKFGSFPSQLYKSLNHIMITGGARQHAATVQVLILNIRKSHIKDFFGRTRMVMLRSRIMFSAFLGAIRILGSRSILPHLVKFFNRQIIMG